MPDDIIEHLGTDPAKWAEGAANIVGIRMADQERKNCEEILEAWFSKAIQAGRDELHKESKRLDQLRDAWSQIAAGCLLTALRGRNVRFWLNRFREAFGYSTSASPPERWPHGNPAVWLKERKRV